MVVDNANAFLTVNQYEFGDAGKLLSSSGHLASVERAEGKKVAWRVPTEVLETLIKTKDLLIVGGDGFAAAHSVDDGQMLWRQEVDGRVRGLAAAANRLYVSTDAGLIYCFGKP